MVTRKSSGIPNMKYTYRFEHVKLLNKKCFIESDDKRDLLAVREDQIHDFNKFYYLNKHEKESYNRIKEWLKENHPEYLI